MFTILVQKAQSFIDPALSPISAEKRPAKSTLFRSQFRLPDFESPLAEITAELNIPILGKSKNQDQEPGQGNIYAGKLHLSENFLCFSTQASSFQQSASTQTSTVFTGPTHGAGPAGNGFTLPLCAIRKVQRLHSQNALVALSITTWNGLTSSTGEHSTSSHVQRFTLQLAGSQQACDQFCDGLKKGLRNGISQVESLKIVVRDCYSEYMLSGKTLASKDGELVPEIQREPPDTGLGMIHRYPGDPRKLRDRSKLRLWADYLQGLSGLLDLSRRD